MISVTCLSFSLRSYCVSMSTCNRCRVCDSSEDHLFHWKDALTQPLYQGCDFNSGDTDGSGPFLFLIPRSDDSGDAPGNVTNYIEKICFFYDNQQLTTIQQDTSRLDFANARYDGRNHSAFGAGKKRWLIFECNEA